MATGKATSEQLKGSNLFNCSHITAVVTGGGSGIGLMICQALVANGAKVYITGRRQQALDTVVAQYSTGPGQLIAFPGDISEKQDAIRIAKDLESKEPQGIQLLVNNAGIARDDKTSFSKNGKPDVNDAAAISAHFLRSEEQDWADTFRTNVTGQYWMAMALLPLLAKGTSSTKGYSSSVVNVASISGVMKGSSMGQFAYASSKAASIHLTRMLATTFKDVKVRVNCIAPGLFPSEMTAGKSGADQKSELDESNLSNPSGRVGHDTDMAATLLFLVGPGSTFINEQIIYPDGGNTLVQPATN